MNVRVSSDPVCHVFFWKRNVHKKIDMSQGKTHRENSMVGHRQDLRDSGSRPWAPPMTMVKRGEKSRNGDYLNLTEVLRIQTDVSFLFYHFVH